MFGKVFGATIATHGRDRCAEDLAEHPESWRTWGTQSTSRKTFPDVIVLSLGLD